MAMTLDAGPLIVVAAVTLRRAIRLTPGLSRGESDVVRRDFTPTERTRRC
jgi:hypothetical protein